MKRGSFLDMMREMHAEDSRDERLPVPEAQVMNLLELAKGYRKHDYAPGDLVTRRRQTGGETKGRPHLVLETLDNPAPDFNESIDPTSQVYGARRDVRVLVCMGSAYCAFWCESWELEPYKIDDDHERTSQSNTLANQVAGSLTPS